MREWSETEKRIRKLQADMADIALQGCLKAIYSYEDGHGHKPKQISIPVYMYHLMTANFNSISLNFHGMPRQFMGLDMEIKQRGMPTCQ